MKVASHKFLQTGAVIVALIFSGMFFFTAIQRLLYPYDLDFLEDGVLMESLRFAQGQPVYVPPNADFNPHVYMPLFFMLGGLLFKLGQPSLILLRTISMGATIATTSTIYGIARIESGEAWIAIACAGLFLGGYRINGFWYEAARVDSLFVALTLGGFAMANYANGSSRRLFFSAILLALAAFTKQSGFIIAAGLGIYLLMTTGRKSLIFILTWSGLTLIPMLILNISTHGWFFYHIFYIGSADPIEVSRLVNFITKELFGVMAGLSLTMIIILSMGLWKSGWRVLQEHPWLVATGLAIAISGLGRLRVGGNINNRMPAYALLCLAPAILFRIFNQELNFGEKLRKINWTHYRELLIAGLILFQFALSNYSPRNYIPSVTTRQSGDRLIQHIASTPGNVFVMMHPFYTVLAGKEPSTQIATLWYVRHRGDLPLPEDFVDRIKSHYYSEIISDESFFETQPDLRRLITAYYSDQTLTASESPRTNTGVIVQPKVVYLPKEK